MPEDKNEKKLRARLSTFRKEEVEERLLQAEAILDTFGGPGGRGRYANPDDAKEARKLYMRAYRTIWQKGKPYAPDSETKTLHRRERQKRPTDVKKFYLDMLQADYAECLYCGSALKPWQREADHYIPLGRGGAHTASNLVICCGACNYSKGIKTPEEFKEWKRVNRKGPVE